MIAYEDAVGVLEAVATVRREMADLKSSHDRLREALAIMTFWAQANDEEMAAGAHGELRNLTEDLREARAAIAAAWQIEGTTKVLA